MKHQGASDFVRWGRRTPTRAAVCRSASITIAGCLSPWIFWGCLTRRAPARSSPKDVESDQGAPQDEQQSPQDHDRARLRPDEGGDERGVEAQGDRRPLAQNPRAPDGYTKEDESRSVGEEGHDEYNS